MCCGKKRSNVERIMNIAAPAHPVNIGQEVMAGINFKYTGQTALTVTGNISGRRYRFSQPGEIQLIDYRDAGSIRTIPLLERLE